MKKFVLLGLVVCCLSFTTANAQVAITFSTSSTDANAGTVFDLNDGDTGSIFVWAENNDASGNDLDALAIDISGSGSSTLTANSFDVVNGGRWSFVRDATLGSSPDSLLVEDSSSIFLAFPGTTGGIENAGGPVLHATLNFTAAGVGSNTLGIAEGAGLISAGGVRPQTLSLGSATVNVTTAVPEPGSFVLISSLVGCVLLRRRRV